MPTPLTAAERAVLQVLRTRKQSVEDHGLHRLIARTGLERNTVVRALRGLEARDLVVEEVDATLGTPVWFTTPRAWEDVDFDQ
jgi:DNA-binding MarR family transcriptional regulator